MGFDHNIVGYQVEINELHFERTYRMDSGTYIWYIPEHFIYFFICNA